MARANFDWRALPPGLRRLLLLGGEGKPHLTLCARLALADPAAAPLGLDLLLAAWEAGPLDGGLAATLVRFDACARRLPPGVRALAGTVSANWRPPADASIMERLAARREHRALIDLLSDSHSADPGNLFWRQHLLDLCYLLADWERALAAARSPWPGGLEALREKVLGDIRFQLGDFEAASVHYAAGAGLRPACFRRGQALFRQGRDREAQEAWRAALLRAPWNVNLALRLASRLSGLDRPGAAGLRGRVAVCLYTCGKPAEVDATLGALFAAHAPNVLAAVLDNASPPETAAVIDAWRERAGRAMKVIRLPVNIGAPAARNWLMRDPDVAACEYVAYLDDDALLPPDWQARMAAVARAWPGAGVWGCKVVDLAAPARIQNADVNFQSAHGPEPVLASLCSQDIDFGQFDYARPCLSVTGCFHLFRADVLRRCGDFDIRFSPTQYDDLDHDLRLAAMGLAAVYQGHLTVRHARLSGALLAVAGPAAGNSRGNQLKLWAKHPEAQRLAMLEAADEAMLLDVLARAPG
jgi:hypothetical protein